MRQRLEGAFKGAPIFSRLGRQGERSALEDEKAREADGVCS
jgi:hypothetical protein